MARQASGLPVLFWTRLDLAQRNYRTAETDCGRAGSRVHRHFDPIAKHQQLHCVRFQRTLVKCLYTGAHRSLLKLFADFVGHPRGFGEKPQSAARRRSQTRIGIEVNFNSFGLSGHGTLRGLRRRPPCNPGNSTTHPCTIERRPFLCRYRNTCRTCSRIPVYRTANIALDRRASLSPVQNFNRLESVAARSAVSSRALFSSWVDGPLGGLLPIDRRKTHSDRPYRSAG